MEPDQKVYMIIFVCGEAQTMEQLLLLMMMMMISALFRLSKKGCVHRWARGGGWGGDTPMHEVKPYVVTYAFFGFTIHHRGSKLTVARPCVVVFCAKLLETKVADIGL